MCKKRWIAACVVPAWALISPVSSLDAAEPAREACVGATFSGAAQALRELGAPPGSMGAIVSGFARLSDGRPGLGDAIQSIQAGLVPDEVSVNACND